MGLNDGICCKTTIGVRLVMTSHIRLFLQLQKEKFIQIRMCTGNFFS